MPLAYDEDGNELYKFELLKSGGDRQIDTDALISRYDQRISMSILADFLLLGHEAVGSNSLGVSKIEMFVSSLEAWLTGIARIFDTQAFPQLLSVNGIDPELSPTLVYGNVVKEDLKSVADYVQKMVGANAITPDDDLEKWVREMAGAPQSENGFMSRPSEDPIEPTDDEQEAGE